MLLSPRFGSDEMSPLYENRCLTVGLVQMHRQNVDDEGRFDPGEPRGEPHPRLTQAHAAQGGVTLGPEQG